MKKLLFLFALLLASPALAQFADQRQYAPTSGGSANIQTVAIPNYSLNVGVVVRFIPGFTNTGAMTLSINGGTAKVVEKMSSTGLVGLSGGELRAGQVTEALYDGAAFELLGLSSLTLPPGVVGDGVTNNNAALQAAFTAASAGGQIHLPCGTFKITANLSITIANGQHVEFSGSGPDCTFLYVSGAVNGPTFNFSGIYASVTVRDMTILTDQTATTTAIKLVQTTGNPNPGLSGMSRIANVNTYGTGGRASSAYFSVAVDIENVSNVVMNNIQCQGLTTGNAGTCVYLNGDVAGTTVAGVYNLSNIQSAANTYGVYINDWVQGVDITASNFTSGGYGVAQNGSPTGLIDLISITNSQFGNNQFFDIGLTAPGTNNIQDFVIGNSFLEGRTGFSNAGGVFLSGQDVLVTGNTWAETVATTRPALTLAGSYSSVTGNSFQGGITGSDIAIAANGVGTTITGNTVNAFTNGIVIASGATITLASGNNMVLNTTDYVNNSTATGAGLAIQDTKPRLISALWACNASDLGSTANVGNASSPTYGAAFSGTGTVSAVALCSAAGWVAH